MKRVGAFSLSFFAESKAFVGQTSVNLEVKCIKMPGAFLDRCCTIDSRTSCAFAQGQGHSLCGITVAGCLEQQSSPVVFVPPFVWCREVVDLQGVERSAVLVLYLPSLAEVSKLITILRDKDVGLKVPVRLWWSSECGAEHSPWKGCSVLKATSRFTGGILARAMTDYGRGLVTTVVVFEPPRGFVSNDRVSLAAYFGDAHEALQERVLGRENGLRRRMYYSIELIAVRERDRWIAERGHVLQRCSGRTVMPARHEYVPCRQRRGQPPSYTK